MPRDVILSPHIRLCTTQIACDGSTLVRGRTICGKCEAAQKRKQQPPKPLRGENRDD